MLMTPFGADVLHPRGQALHGDMRLSQAAGAPPAPDTTTLKAPGHTHEVRLPYPIPLEPGRGRTLLHGWNGSESAGSSSAPAPAIKGPVPQRSSILDWQQPQQQQQQQMPAWGESPAGHVESAEAHHALHAPFPTDPLAASIWQTPRNASLAPSSAANSPFASSMLDLQVRLSCL